MTRSTEDELGELLAETFRDREHLADPERAVAIAAAPGRAPRRVGRTVLGAAAAVALVAAGTTYVVSRGSGSAGPEAGPLTPRATTSPGTLPLPALQTDAANRAAAVAASDAAAARLPVYPGAQETDAAGVPELGDSTLSLVQPSRVVVRSRFWTVTGVTPKTVAAWYVAHPAAGFSSESGVGGSLYGTTWVDVASWDPEPAPTSQKGTWAEIETTNTSHGVGIRVTVSSVYLPARPPSSFVQAVTSIDVRSEHDRLARHPRHTVTSFTVTSPAKVRRAAIAFNALPGMTPLTLPCPMQVDQWTDRIVFHTILGDVVAVDHTSDCGFGMTVRRDGRVVNPQLGDTQALLAALGIPH